MSDENILPGKSSPDHKSLSRHRWREKLSRRDSKGSKDDQARDEDIHSFLHVPNDGRAASTPSELESPPESNLPASGNLPYSAASSQAKSKRPRMPNLSVTFSTAPPILIGEGGDEAMAPVAELLSTITSPKVFSEVFKNAGSQDDHIAPQSTGSVYTAAEDDLFPPGALQRRSTGPQYDDQGGSNFSSEQEIIPEDTDRLPPESDVSFRHSLNEKALREDPQLVRSALAERNHLEYETLWEDRGIQAPASTTLHLPLLDPATSFANSLTPLPSPQPSRKPGASTKLDASFPATHGGHAGDLAQKSSRSPERVTQQPHRQISPKPVIKSHGSSIRDVTKGLGDDAYMDFATRVQSFRNVFLLRLDARKEPTLQQWVTAATWWFFKGRSGLENSVRSEPKHATTTITNTDYLPHELKQAYVDLAKSWWIVAEMTPTRYPEVKRLESRGPLPISIIMQTFIDATAAELIQMHLLIISNLRSLTLSMKRNGRLPPTGLELQGLDTRVFIAYSLLSPSAARLMSLEMMGVVAGNEHRGTKNYFPMPIKDTERHFNYGRMFVEVILDHGKTADTVTLPCLLSILRDKKDREITLAVASQDWQVHLIIQPEGNSALTWRDAQFDTKYRCIRLDLRADFQPRIQLTERDFRTVWGIHDYIRGVQKQSRGSKNETLVFEKVLRSFQYYEPAKAEPQFPTQLMEGCRLRLFECFQIITEGAGDRKMHDGYRLMVVTPPTVKTLSSVSFDVGKQVPIVFSYLRDEQGAPAMLLKMSKSSRDSSMVMGFEEQADRERLYSLLNGTRLADDEWSSGVLSLKGYSVSTSQGHEDGLGNEAAGLVDRLDWTRLQVLSQRAQQDGYGATMLRICAECDMGSFADRLNLGICESHFHERALLLMCTTGPGELQMRLDFDARNRIMFARSPQRDMTMCFADNTLSKELYESVRQKLDEIARSRSIRSFEFGALKDLHHFQALTTGFAVLFDGFAKSFAISRRRMVVPLYKRWEASATRLQVVRREKIVQLVAFFQEFSHGSCMNFVLKSTDVFQSFSRSGTPYICLVDAKFALPKEQSDPDHEFVCLGMPEYPAQHDFVAAMKIADAALAKPANVGLVATIPNDCSRNVETKASNDRIGLGDTDEVYPTALQAPMFGHTTQAIHGDDSLNVVQDVAPPMHVSTTFRYAKDPEKLIPAADAEVRLLRTSMHPSTASLPLRQTSNPEAHVYSRITAPNATRLEQLLSSLVHAPCLTYSSGLAALHAVYVLLHPKRVSIGGGYHGSHGVLGLHQRLSGTEVLPLDCVAPDLQAGDVIHLETPLNPTGEAYNIEEFAEKAHSRGAILLVDATFGPPGLQDPFECGADIVMHSGTKYIGGHSDMLCGILATRNKTWLAGLYEDREFLGSVMGSMEGWLGVRSVRTLDLRIKRQSESAGKLVHWLNTCKNTDNEDKEAELIKSVVHSIKHASLQHEDMHWLKKQMPNGFGPVFAIWMEEKWMARRLPSHLSLFHHATSLGGVEGLVEWRSMSDSTVDPRLVRVSVGIEDFEDLKADFINGFRALATEGDVAGRERDMATMRIEGSTVPATS
ncbi:MAG: hypothetical protein Q9177_001361, partial [Variospora cf. flavescens]